jgi:hypothetical protein
MTEDHPPRPPLAFRVGFVGHRPDRLAHADAAQLATALRAILDIVRAEILATHAADRALYSGDAPVLRAVSPLAEGADRVFAAQALDAGCELCCVLPFPQAEFERDFAPDKALEKDSVARFRELHGRATTRFELDGSRADEAGAYGACGSVVLAQSDLLVAVWDGVREHKRGGTEETLEAALQQGVPVVWVDARRPHGWQMLAAGGGLPSPAAGARALPGDPAAAEALRRVVREALVLPAAQEQDGHAVGGSAGAAGGTPVSRWRAWRDARRRERGDPRVQLEQFLAAKQPRRTAAVVWKAFRDVVGDGTWPEVEFRVAPFEEAVQAEWPDVGSPAIDSLASRLRPHFAWADGLAVLHADRYRSVFVLAFALAGLAVGLALLPVGLQLESHGAAETACYVGEVVAIAFVLGLVWCGWQQRWHERWIDDRLAAELLRHLRLVAPLGGARPFPQVPAHWARYGQPGASWMAWYVRAVERAIGLPTTVVDREHLQAGLAHLAALLDGQGNWHRTAAQRSHRIEQRLHFCGIALLALTLLACVLHLVPVLVHGVQLPDRLHFALTFCCGFFPALGAACAGIYNQGEFRRIARRSHAMHDQLNALLGHVRALQTEVAGAAEGPASPQFSRRAVALAGDAARLMLNEVLDWRVVFLDQPLRPPA